MTDFAEFLQSDHRFFTGYVEALLFVCWVREVLLCLRVWTLTSYAWGLVRQLASGPQ